MARLRLIRDAVGPAIPGTGGLFVTDHERSPRRPRRQHAVIQDQVDARPRRQHREPLQQFDRIKQQVRRPVRPRVLEREPYLTLGCQTEPVLCDGRPKHVSHTRSRRSR